MSTAGKVLIVLIVLALLGWLVSFSMVAQLNRSWGEHVQQLTAQADKLEKDTQASLAEAERLKTSIGNEQVALRQNLALLRTQISMAERTLSDSKETQQRVSNQLAETNTALADAQSAVERRTREVAALTLEKNEAVGEVNQLRAEVGGLMDQLRQLRTEFQATLDENRSLLQRLAGSGAAPGRRTGERPDRRPVISLIP